MAGAELFEMNEEKKGCELKVILKIGELGEEGYPREKNPFAQRRPEFSWLHIDRFHGAGT